MNALFKNSSYSTMYGTADEVPNDIVQNNAAACRNILNNPKKFPKADLESVKDDLAFLEFECNARGIIPCINHPFSNH